MQEKTYPTYFERIGGDLDAALAELTRLQPDMIIEGGSNNRSLLKNSALTVLRCPYIGLDLNTEIDFRRSTFTRYGNCLLPKNVTPIIIEHQSQHTALLTYNALNALLSSRINHEERKDPGDILSLKAAVENITQLYQSQLHIVFGGSLESLEPFYRLSHESGWRIKDFGQGDLILMTR